MFEFYISNMMHHLMRRNYSSYKVLILHQVIQTQKCTNSWINTSKHERIYRNNFNLKSFKRDNIWNKNTICVAGTNPKPCICHKADTKRQLGHVALMGLASSLLFLQSNAPSESYLMFQSDPFDSQSAEFDCTILEISHNLVHLHQ